MHEHSYADYERRKSELLDVAHGILNGEVGILEGSHAIAAIRHVIDPEQRDEDLLGLAGVESQTDHLALGDLRGRWDPELLIEKEAEIARWESFFRSTVLECCRCIISSYGDG